MAVTVKENVNPEIMRPGNDEDPKDILQESPPRPKTQKREKIKLRKQPEISEIN